MTTSNNRYTTLGFNLSFHAPAFLGNAEQQGQWRTPPIKALLRQWWRVAYAADQRQGVDLGAMRRAEGRLFGVAADGEGESRQSALRLRLGRWDVGTLKQWGENNLPLPVRHPEVPRPVDSHLYLGYGPLLSQSNQGKTKTALKSGAALQAGQHAELRLAFPSAHDEAKRLLRALALMNLYGTLGGRSRNGWGSFSLTPLEGTTALATTLDTALTLPWRDALQSDWAQALGTDARGPLIWQTEPQKDWSEVMRCLARIKIGLRTQFVFRSGKNASAPEDRHWLSYPVTNHSVQPWGNNARLPNSLRFKVRPAPDGKLVGVIFHVPCLPPASFRPDRVAIARVWEQVHRYLDLDLDEAPRLTRLPA